MKKEFIFSILLAASLPAAAAHHGRVFVDKNHNGSFDKGEKVLKDVKVSDGLNVVKTDANGMYTLPGHERERFVFITLPSGYKAGDKHYHRRLPGITISASSPIRQALIRKEHTVLYRYRIPKYSILPATKHGPKTSANMPPMKNRLLSYIPATSATKRD